MTAAKAPTVEARDARAIIMEAHGYMEAEVLRDDVRAYAKRRRVEQQSAEVNALIAAAHAAGRREGRAEVLDMLTRYTVRASVPGLAVLPTEYPLTDIIADLRADLATKDPKP